MKTVMHEMIISYVTEFGEDDDDGENDAEQEDTDDDHSSEDEDYKHPMNHN